VMETFVDLASGTSPLGIALPLEIDGEKSTPLDIADCRIEHINPSTTQ
jgi:hypothetical protein